MRALHVRPEAELDLFEAALWYDGERAGLGMEFLEAVRYVFSLKQGGTETQRQNELAGQIIAACIEVRRHLGPGLLESAREQFHVPVLREGLRRLVNPTLDPSGPLFLPVHPSDATSRSAAKGTQPRSRFRNGLRFFQR